MTVEQKINLALTINVVTLAWAIWWNLIRKPKY